MKGLKRLKGLKGRVGKEGRTTQDTRKTGVGEGEKGRMGEGGKGGKEGRRTQDAGRKEEVVFIRIPSCLSAEASVKAEEGLGVGQKRRRTHDAG